MNKKANILHICQDAKAASRILATLDSKVKNRALIAMGGALIRESKYLIRENKKDVALAVKNGLSKALIDRLTLSESSLRSMANAFSDVAKLKDPVGEVIESVRRPNGLKIAKVRVPIGVILMIYESRPNVTSDCASLCLKSGNAAILRGGKESINSNIAIYKVLDRVATRSGLPKASITLIQDTDRKIVDELLKLSQYIDLVIPRGGESLIRSVAEKSRIPVIKHYKGVCHTFVDESADIKMAEDICFNAKVQRPGVCNAMETLLVHERIAKRFLPNMIARYKAANVEIRGCKKTRSIVTGIKSAAMSDWYAEYLDLILAVKVVKSVGEAIEHIMKYGSYHSDAIVTSNKKNAEKFLRGVDSAAVFVNASTRFTDGGQFGKGAEIGISTDKIHARGPMGLEELTSYKYIIHGNGQVRE